MTLDDVTSFRLPLTAVFGPALDASATWIGLAGHDHRLIAANRSLQRAVADVGTADGVLTTLLPCWSEHTGAVSSFACPCPRLASRPCGPGVYCQATPPRFPALITSQAVPAADGPEGLRLLVVEPQLTDVATIGDPSHQVSRTLTRIRAAIDEAEHNLLSEMSSGGGMLRPAGLSSREWDVAQALSAGAHAPEVAVALGISVHTVRNHLKSVFRKLNVRTQAELRRRLLSRSLP